MVKGGRKVKPTAKKPPVVLQNVTPSKVVLQNVTPKKSSPFLDPCKQSRRKLGILFAPYIVFASNTLLSTFLRKGKEKMLALNRDVILGVIEVAKYLSTTRKTIYKLIQEGLFPTPVFSQKVGKRTMRAWEISELEKFRPRLRPPYRTKKIGS